MRRILVVVALACTFGVATGQQAGSAAAQRRINAVQNQGNPEYKAPRALTQGSAGAASTINKTQGLIRNSPPEPDLERSARSVEKGKSAFTKRDYKTAIDHFTNAIDFNPKAADNYALRAKAYSLLKKHPEAIADCDMAIGLGVVGPSTAALRKLSEQALVNAKK